MTLTHEIIHLCEVFNIRLDPEKGQNFLISERILDLEVEVANLMENDVVLDIGAGFGFLTERIAERVAHVYAVEIDRKIAEAFKFRLKKWVEIGKIDLIIGDFLKLELPKELTKIVSNPPYSISSELMIKIIKELYKNKNFESSVMILQKDFVKRLFANPCSKNWGRISATFRYYTEGDIITTIPKKVFFPKPEVDSSLIKFWFKRDKSLLEFKLFEKITALLFQGPNKKIRRILKGILKKKTSEWESILRNLRKEVDLDKRVRCLSLSDIEKIGEKMIEYNLV